jgi:hypothetical protein
MKEIEKITEQLEKSNQLMERLSSIAERALKAFESLHTAMDRMEKNFVPAPISENPLSQKRSVVKDDLYNEVSALMKEHYQEVPGHFVTASDILDEIAQYTIVSYTPNTFGKVLADIYPGKKITGTKNGYRTKGYNLKLKEL